MLIIVPNLPPNIDGVGDYAYLLAQELRIVGVRNIQFLIAGDTNYSFEEWDNFPVRVLTQRSELGLTKALNEMNVTKIHLHYVGYGYEKRGIPDWLSKGLLKWKKNKQQVLIITFHELFASSLRPWTHSFWTQYMQRRICKRLYLLTDHVVLASKREGRILHSFKQNKIEVLPIFSNLGEAENRIPLAKRKKQLVVLGSSENREIIYRNHSKEIENFCTKIGIEKIIDIGEKICLLNRPNTPLISMGILKSEEISKILTESYAGVFGAYSAAFFAKSGVFAAYAAHGVLMLVFNTKGYDEDEKIFLKYHSFIKGTSDINLDQISESCFQWYKKHSLKKQTLVYKSIYI